MRAVGDVGAGREMILEPQMLTSVAAFDDHGKPFPDPVCGVVYVPMMV